MVYDKMCEIKRKRMAKGWKYPSNIPNRNRSPSPQRSAVTLNGERSEAVTATIQARKQALKASGALSYDTWLQEKKRQAREKMDYFKQLQVRRRGDPPPPITAS